VTSLADRDPYGILCPECHGLGTIGGGENLEGETLSSVLCPLCDGSGRRGIVADQTPVTAPDRFETSDEIDRALAALAELLREEWPALDPLERRRRLFNLMFQLDSLAGRLP
jgi:hypothetical protein